MSEARRAVAVAAVALLLSAALLPAFGGGSGADGRSGGQGEGAGGDGVSLSELLEPLLGERTPEGERPRPRTGTPEGGGATPQLQPDRGGEGQREGGSGGAIGRLADLVRAVLGPGNATVDGTVDRPDRMQLYVLGETVPGERVTLYVVDGDGPVAGVPLYVNEEYAGTTDQRGRLDVQVPYAAEMNVTAGPAPDGDAGGTGSDAADGSFGVDTGPALAPVAWLRPPLGLAGVSPATDGSRSQASANDTNRTVGRQVDLPTDANLSVVGEPAPGATVTLVATVADRPFRGANIVVDGERVGRTDRRGEFDYTFGRVRFAEIVVERGAVSGGRRVAVEPVNLTLRGLAVPGRPVTARVTLRGDPVVGVPVRFDGERVGHTGPRGEIRARVPIENRLVVAARTEAGVPVRRVVDWMLLPLALVPVGVAALVGGGRYADRRTDRGLGTAARTRIARLAEAALAALVGAAGRLDRVAGRLLAAVRDAVGRVTGTVRQSSPLAALRRLLAAFRDRLRGIASVGTAIGSGGRASADGPPEPPTNGVADGSEARNEGEGARERVRAAWRRLLSRAGIRRHRTLSPGEARERALAADPDLPREAVDRLTEAFRAVEYGDTDPRDVLADVREATRQLDDEDGGDGNGGGEQP